MSDLQAYPLTKPRLISRFEHAGSAELTGTNQIAPLLWLLTPALTCFTHKCRIAEDEASARCLPGSVL